MSERLTRDGAGTIGQQIDLDRWQQISELLAATLDLEADERTALLDEECSEDPSLRHEVESYLRADEAMGDFIDKPLFSWRRQETGSASGKPDRRVQNRESHRSWRNGYRLSGGEVR